MAKTVRLIENFCSFQGEGPDVGRAMVILRFKKCNLNCRWCDTKVKMRISNEADYPLNELQDIVYDKNVGLLITGGEPTFHTNLEQTVMLLNELHYPRANVETNGFCLDELVKSVRDDAPVKYIYSPKIFSEEDLDNAISKLSLFKNNGKVWFKIVYEKNELIHHYLKTITSVDEIFRSQRIYLMPEGTTREKLLLNSSEVFDACEEYQVNFSSREHIIYGFI